MSTPLSGDSSSPGVPGVRGTATGAGVIGVYGESANAEAVRGVGHQGAGVSGTSEAWIGVYGESTNADGVRGVGHKGVGVSGTSEVWIGVYGESTSGQGVRGVGHKGAGVSGLSEAWIGTHGESTNYEGVRGVSHAADYHAGVVGINDNTAATAGAGVFGKSTQGEGVHGETNSASSAAVAGIALGSGPAGYFRGNVIVTGDISFAVNAGDCAEEFTVADDADVDAGTVVVIGRGEELRACDRAYDRCVAGVVSGAGHYRPGLILDKQASSANRAPLALVGKVYCKVDADHGPIDVGDLLTTSPTPGHAMKATDATRSFGAVIGKALGAIEKGRGLIPILVALQ